MTISKRLSFMADAGEHGNFWLDVHIRDGATIASGAVLDIIALHELEGFTQSFENTLKHPLDWYPSREPRPATELLEMTLEFTQESLLVSSTIMLPVSVLKQLLAWKISATDKLRNSFWKPVSSTLCLSRLQLSEDEYADLGEGALVIIPESYESRWNTTLHVANGGLTLQGEYQWPKDAWLQKSMLSENEADSTYNMDAMNSESLKAPASKNDSRTYSVQFDCEIDPVALMDSSNSVNPGLQNILANESGDSELWLRNNDGDRFRGQLLSLGTGQALLLQKNEPVVL